MELSLFSIDGNIYLTNGFGKEYYKMEDVKNPIKVLAPNKIFKRTYYFVLHNSNNLWKISLNFEPPVLIRDKVVDFCVHNLYLAVLTSDCEVLIISAEDGKINKTFNLNSDYSYCKVAFSQNLGNDCLAVLEKENIYKNRGGNIWGNNVFLKTILNIDNTFNDHVMIDCIDNTHAFDINLGFSGKNENLFFANVANDKIMFAGDNRFFPITTQNMSLNSRIIYISGDVTKFGLFKSPFVAKTQSALLKSYGDLYISRWILDENKFEKQIFPKQPDMRNITDIIFLDDCIIIKSDDKFFRYPGVKGGQIIIEPIVLD